MDNANAYPTKNEVQRQVDQGMHRWIEICRSKWPLMKN
jgi:hypothetical protein